MEGHEKRTRGKKREDRSTDTREKRKENHGKGQWGEETKKMEPRTETKENRDGGEGWWRGRRKLSRHRMAQTLQQSGADRSNTRE